MSEFMFTFKEGRATRSFLATSLMSAARQAFPEGDPLAVISADPLKRTATLEVVDGTPVTVTWTRVFQLDPEKWVAGLRGMDATKI